MTLRDPTYLVIGAACAVLLACSGADHDPDGEPAGPGGDDSHVVSPDAGDDRAVADDATDDGADDGTDDGTDDGSDDGDPRDRLDVPDAHAVSAGHPDAVDAGMSVLEDGGTAVDAAIAAAFASGVAEPFTSGLGGGGAAIVLEQGEEPRAYDYRDVVADDGVIPATNTGVPGFVAGMEALHDHHGSLGWDELVSPAVGFAEETTTSPLLAERLAADADALPVGDLPHLYPDGAPLQDGAPLVQDELATTLRILADEGPPAFYEGAIAESLTAYDGLDAASLAGYEVHASTPPSGAVGDVEVIGAAPPLGGTTLIQQLQIAEALGVAEQPPNSPRAVHHLASAWRIALANQRAELGDPRFVDVPVDELVDPDRNAAIAEALDPDSVPSIDPGAPGGGHAPNTTHITAVDSYGTMVSMTNTITNFWGSRQYTDGFFLNDHLRRFEGGTGEANRPEPGKLPVTWSLPVIIADTDGRPVLGLGTPGGARIPNVLASAITRWGLQGVPLEDVVTGPRFHVHGTTIEVEAELGGARDQLLALGWSDVTEPASRLHFGSIQALEIDYDDGVIRGASDPRREADHRIQAPAPR